tara:strand:+ start:1410 stop:1688 length:279 start_codon:yes stop_codon:yes gene_type:complete
MARNKISRTKIGFFFVFIFGVSLYLFVSLEESNVMAFLMPLDVINEFTTILFTDEYDKLNNSKFNTIYIVIFLLIIMGIVATRRARTVLIYR